MSHDVICDRSGSKVKRKDCVIQWDNLLVRKDLVDPFPEYLIPPNTAEDLSVRNARPEGPDVFVTPNPNDL